MKRKLMQLVQFTDDFDAKEESIEKILQACRGKING